MSLREDLIYGTRREIEFMEIIKEKHPKIKKINGRYAVIDFETNKYFIEVKSIHNTYKNWYNENKNAMIGLNKRRFALFNMDKKETLFAWFFNCNTIMIINGSTMKNKDHHNIWDFYINIGGRRDRRKFEYKKYCFIDKTKLINYDDFVF